ncbi:coiled-coil domain-containing protein [Beijerinckia sp. L45]|uniref:coiled-coil domain-containing protein n=1 Tax=Beijerinckia sp. L45 TaxID=1641855 RepID=UPI0034CFB723
MTFDTLKLSKALQGAFTTEQAEALTDAFSSTAQNAREDLATKIDLSNVEIALRADLTKVEASLRGDLTKVEASLRGVEAALKGDILLIQTDLRKVETTLRGEIQNLKVETVKWIVTAIAFNLLGTAGLMIALVKFAK